MSFFLILFILLSMKYLLLVLCLFICSCNYNPYKEDYNYLENNSLRFIKNNDNIELLINKDNIYYLVIIDKEVEDVYYDYLIDMNKEKYISINEVTFRKSDKIEINFNDKLFCIYMKHLDKDNYSDCDFLYLYKIDKDFYVTLNDDIVLLYDSYTKFNYKFMYMLANVWIDSETIDEDSYTTITLKDDDYEITSYKRRGKTIHKRINS